MPLIAGYNPSRPQVQRETAMGSLWKRLVARHAAALGFWAVLALVALALVFAVAMARGF